MISQSSQTPFWNHRRDLLGLQQAEFISGFIREERRKKQKIEQQVKADAKQAYKIKWSTPVLVAAEKNKDGKVSSFPQIRDFLKKKCEPSKTGFATWTAENIVEKWNDFHSWANHQNIVYQMC